MSACVARRQRFIRYRCQSVLGAPLPGSIVMGTSDRVRRAYRVLSARRAAEMPALGVATWKLAVEPMSADAGRAEIAAGAPFWTIKWDARGRRT